MKVLKDYIIVPLCHAINLSFEQEMFPALLKKTLVIPVHEKIIPVPFLNSYKVLAKDQFGFREGRFTKEALAKLTSLIYEELNKLNKIGSYKRKIRIYFNFYLEIEPRVSW